MSEVPLVHIAFNAETKPVGVMLSVFRFRSLRKGILRFKIAEVRCPYDRPIIARGFSDALVLLFDYPHESFMGLSSRAIEEGVPLFLCHSMSILFQVHKDETFIPSSGGVRVQTNPQRLINDLDSFFRGLYSRELKPKRPKDINQCELF